MTSPREFQQAEQLLRDAVDVYLEPVQFHVADVFQKLLGGDWFEEVAEWEIANNKGNVRRNWEDKRDALRENRENPAFELEPVFVAALGLAVPGTVFAGVRQRNEQVSLMGIEGDTKHRRAIYARA